MTRHYGRFPGERGTHFVTGNAELEVVHTDFADNNRAQYRFYGGDQAGEEFDATAEHFTPLNKSSRCPTCGEPVYSIFDHLDQDCGGREPELPEGLIEQDGKVLYQCLNCEAWTEWPADIEDFDINNPHNVCGGSPRCCP